MSKSVTLIKLSSILLLFSAILSSTMSADLSLKFAQNSAQFSIDFYNTLAAENVGKNIIFSPFSIQTAVALAYAGSEGETAAEIANGLKLVANDRALVGESFKGVLDTYADSYLLKIANKIYVKQGYAIDPEFNKIAEESFHSSSEEIDFTKSAPAAKTINSWVEKKTNNKIKDLVSSDSFDSLTRLVLINAIHFKGDWEKKFDKDSTQEEDFFLNEKDSVKVQMMNGKAKYNYGHFEDLDASALELPYKDSDLSMLILLPNSRTGLKNLEQKLKNINLFDLSQRMSVEEVIVKLPKFKVEFEAELTEPLKKLGMKKMFSSSAEFNKLLVSPEPLQVSKVIHKAVIEVNEEGTEAAAATGIQIMAVMARRIRRKRFNVTHPFIYIIKSKKNIPFFVGSLHKPTISVVPNKSINPVRNHRKN